MGRAVHYLENTYTISQKWINMVGMVTTPWAWNTNTLSGKGPGPLNKCLQYNLNKVL